MILAVLSVGLIYLIIKFGKCSSNPAYDAWLAEDKAKYPHLYKKEKK